MAAAPPGVAARRRARGIPKPVVWSGDAVRILDQTRLPRDVRYLDCRTPGEVVASIRSLAVRGAPLIGIAGGYGTALGGTTSGAADARAVLRAIERAGAKLAAARPTALNLPLAVGRVVRAAAEAAAGGADARRVAEAALGEAVRIDQQERDACAAIGLLGAELVPRAPGSSPTATRERSRRTGKGRHRP